MYSPKRNSKKALLLSAAFLVVFCGCRSAEAALSCTPVATDPCLCVGKYFILDINHLFDYPVKNIPDGGNPEKYNYTYSPCRPVVCNTRRGNTSAAVCQYFYARPEYFNCGRINQTEWTISEEGSLSFQIQYSGGDVPVFGGSARSSIVSFVNNESFNQNTIIMVKEEPIGLYHFEVIIADYAQLARSFKHKTQPGFSISGEDNL